MLNFRLEQRLSKIVTHLILAVSAVIIIFPFFWMISTSLKPDAEILRIPPTLLPIQWNRGFYRELLHDTVFLRFFLNSLIVASTGTVISTHTANADLTVVTNASGVAVIDCDKGSAGTIYIMAELASKVTAAALAITGP